MEDLIKNLTEAYGPSGNEKEVSDIIKNLVQDSVDQTFSDSMGNLFALREGPGPLVMISAHMDEIGVIVTHVDNNGFLRIAPVGGVSPHLLVGQRLRFQNGAVGVVYHEKIKKIQELNWSKLYLDIGASDKDSASQQISIGDLACLHQPFTAVNGRYISKSLDDRVGCAILLETARMLPRDLPQGICFVFSVQEELGLRGATTAAFRLDPGYGLAVDVTRVGDTPKAPLMSVALGKGPAIKVKDSSVICHPMVKNFMVETAEQRGLAYQLEVLERGGTDAGAINLSRQGVPSGALSIPCRYIHTPSEMVDAGDVSAAVELLTALCSASWPGYSA